MLSRVLYHHNNYELTRDTHNNYELTRDTHRNFYYKSDQFALLLNIMTFENTDYSHLATPWLAGPISVVLFFVVGFIIWHIYKFILHRRQEKKLLGK